MKNILVSLACLVSFFSKAQPGFELIEYAGTVVSIEPGYGFALERLNMTVDGKQESFMFNPSYGLFLSQKIKAGKNIKIKANVNVKTRKLLNDLSEENRKLSWFFFRDQIKEIIIGNELIVIKEFQISNEKRERESKSFIDKKVSEIYIQDGYKKGLIFDNGLVGYASNADKHYDPLKSFEKGDSISFIGFKMRKEEGFKYPIDGVKDVYYLSRLNKAEAKLRSLLFKQNEVCIGVKFIDKSGKELKLSFPSDKAMDVKRFLSPDIALKVYYGQEYNISKLDLPELHAVIQNRDTLFINEFGFFGGADVDHEQKEVEVNGKITKINASANGNIMSLIVASEYYIEIEAMMAQQLGLMFQKGKVIQIKGKERIKKQGEIYKKDYKIVTPEKIVIDGKTFSQFQP